MTHRCPQRAVNWKLKSSQSCQATGPAVLLLACAAAMLHLSSIEARSLQTIRSGLRTSERRLESIALPAGSAGEGWTLGRASLNKPSAAFANQFTELKFGTWNNGDCGLYDGADDFREDDPSTETVPADMQVGVAWGNSDYPGSCGRCYELRCVNSIVPGNYSSNNTPVPAAIAQDQFDPIYTHKTYSSGPAVDDYNRTFPGNVLNATKQLFTQCWNQTDAQGLLSPSGSIIVQVTDTCPCIRGGPDPCCTNIPHFNLHYQAFQKLAHPDYSLLSLMFRPVDCSTKKALPVEPGFVSKTIYKDQVGSGWGVGGSAVRRLQDVNQGLFGSNASCFDLQTADDELFFYCRDCDRPGYQPFLLSNTSGLEFYIRQTSASAVSGGSAQPLLTLTLGAVVNQFARPSYSPLCNGSSLDVSPSSDAEAYNSKTASRRRVLFQNGQFRSCIPYLDQVTSFRIQSTSRVSICMDDIRLLPSTLQPAGSGSKIPQPGIPLPDYLNCNLFDPQPIDQEGNYIAGVHTELNQNLSHFTVLPFTAFPSSTLRPLLGTCFASNSSLTIIPDLVQRVNNCTDFDVDKTCCYKAAEDEGNGLLDTLTQVCSNMATNGSICQGFVYLSYTRIAFFKGGPPQTSLDTSGTKVCRSPNVTTWLLTAGLQSEPDSRVVAGIELESAKPACNLSSQLSNQDLRELTQDHALSMDVKHDVAANSSDLSTAYTVTSNTDLQNYLGLTYACSVPSNSTLNAAVQACASLNSRTCCVEDSSLSLTKDSMIPDTLANICNSIRFVNPPANSSNFCQGFVYDDARNTAFFKPQPANGLLDTNNLCSSPTSHTWLRTQATTGGTVQPVQPLSPFVGDTSTGDTLKTVLGVLAAVFTGSVTALTWFAVTYSYRTDKKTMVTEVVKHLKIADVASAAESAQAAAPQPITNTTTAQNISLQRLNSGPSSQLLPTQSSSTQSADSYAVQNPLLLVPGLSHATATSSRQGSNAMAGPSADMKDVARQITVRCLRRWDGFLGIRASSDGVGRRSGIWKDKFDGVHFAVLLLAMHRLNETLSSAETEPSCIQAAWRQGDHVQRNKLLDQLARVLQNVSEDEAQALPDKDPEVPGMYDKLCSMMVCCR